MDEPVEVGASALVKRHRLATRIWHWVNATAVFVLLMSGLMISNAHPMLYWGQFGANFDQLWLHLPQFPGSITLPSTYNLALARRWHLAFAWILALGLLVHVIAGLVNGHFRTDLRLRAEELKPRHLWADVKAHALLRFPQGAAALKYNTLQKLTYIAVLFGLLPMLIATGLCLMPGISPLTGWAIDLLGGRATARSLHFLAAGAAGAFIAVHLALVVLAGPYNEIRAMVTGRWRLSPDRQAGEAGDIGPADEAI